MSLALFCVSDRRILFVDFCVTEKSVNKMKPHTSDVCVVVIRSLTPRKWTAPPLLALGSVLAVT